MKSLNESGALMAVGLCFVSAVQAVTTQPQPGCCLSIPATSRTSDVFIQAYAGAPGHVDSILTVTTSNNVGLQIDGTFAIHSGVPYAAWCVDTSAEINPGNGTPFFGASFYSTCDLTTLNSVIGSRYTTVPTAEQWREVDWIMNHRSSYSFINAQVAIWTVLGLNTSGIDFSQYNIGTQIYDPTLVAALVSGAVNSTWQPGCGDKVAVVMVLPDVKDALGNVIKKLQYIALEVPCVCPPPPANPGTGTPGFWKNHPDAWPVSSIVVGCRTWSKSAAIAQLSLPDGGNKWNTMFRGVLCAKLNVLIGNDPSCIQANITAGDLWLCNHSSPVPASSPAWVIGSPIYTQLDDYNNGLLCAPHRN